VPKLLIAGDLVHRTLHEGVRARKIPLGTIDISVFYVSSGGSLTSSKLRDRCFTELRGCFDPSSFQKAFSVGLTTIAPLVPATAAVRTVMTSRIKAGEGGQYKIEGQDAILTVQRRAPTTPIGRAVVQNQVAIQINALSFLAATHLKLEAMHTERFYWAIYSANHQISTG
jgi:hypothetical protein